MNKEAFKSEAKATIDTLFRKIDTLEHKKDNIREDLRASIESQLAELRKQQHELHERYDQLAAAGAGSWEEVKTAFSKSAGHFRKAVSNISEQFNH
ncbi:MAG: hypothetical protein IPK76_03125 [Lewinellaceae bacterium]|nr:hypothetical protein [Lewinellaceae bacterium]